MRTKCILLIWSGIYLILGVTQTNFLFSQYPDFQDNRIKITGTIEIDRMDENGGILSICVSVLMPTSVLYNMDQDTLQEENEISEYNMDEEYIDQVDDPQTEIVLIGDGALGAELINKIGQVVQITGHVTNDFFGYQVIHVDSYYIIEE